MKYIKSINTIPVQVNVPLLNKSVEPHLAPFLLDKYKKINQQKTIEICHIGKFLQLFDENLRITGIPDEYPDCLIEGDIGIVGLEHTRLINSELMAEQGFYKNIFLHAEREIQSDPDFPDFVANCLLHNQLKIKGTNKKDLIKVVKDTLKNYIINNNLKKNSVISNIFVEPSPQKGEKVIRLNSGGWFKKEVPNKLIESAVLEKEKRIQSYKNTSFDYLWLLLVFGEGYNSSYDYINTSISVDLETNFDRVFILHDFSNLLYEIE